MTDGGVADGDLADGGGAGGPALTMAADVRAGRRSATDVLGGYLAAIEAGEPAIGAFNHLMIDEAAAAAARVDELVAGGEDPGPLAGVPIALKDNLCTRGVPTTCSSRILEGWLPPYDATVVDPLAAGRGGRRRQDQPRRVRHGIVDGELGVRADPQSTGSDPGPRRVVGWKRSRGGGRVQPPRARHRTPAARSASPPPSAASSA